MKITERNLRRTIRKAVSGLLNERADEKEWAYLLSSPFSARNALAAHYCDHYDADSILEVGGYRNPITQFYKGPASRITMVDPMLTNSRQVHKTGGNKCNVTQLRGRLHDFDIEPHDTVVCLGMSLYDTDTNEQRSYDRFKELCKSAKTVIMEVPTEWEHSVNSANDLMHTLPHEKIVDISMDFTPSNVKDIEKIHNKRRLIVLRNESRGKN